MQQTGTTGELGSQNYLAGPQGGGGGFLLTTNNVDLPKREEEKRGAANTYFSLITVCVPAREPTVFVPLISADNHGRLIGKLNIAETHSPVFQCHNGDACASHRTTEYEYAVQVLLHRRVEE